MDAAGPLDTEARYRRAHQSRRVRAWSTAGVWGDRAPGWPPAHRADALVNLARGDDPPVGPDTTVHVVVDYEALVRGDVAAGECCEIPGVGPVPVQAPAASPKTRS